MQAWLKEYRMKQANELIRMIANRGRRFFDYTTVKRMDNEALLGSVWHGNCIAGYIRKKRI